jgi:hypothetical protein
MPVRRPLALLSALLLATVIAAPVEAATVHRVFGAGLGTSSANGTIKLVAFTDGNGRADYALKGLRKGATYRVEVRKGRCSNLGVVVARPASFTTTSRGSFTASRGLGFTTAQKIWEANWYSLLAVRIVSGSSIRCGNLNFARATRVRIPSQGIFATTMDLPIVRGPSGYPYCNVAMYSGALNQPTEPGVTFIYAHARKGMFLPLLSQWNANGGARMIGMSVYVYTSNNRVHQYVVDNVRVAKTMDGVFGVAGERLWLQTSTGPNFTYPKLFVEAGRVATSVTTYAASHPAAKIVKCG